jgi:hypothetical protein
MATKKPKPKPAHGGARPGAGRPPNPVPTVKTHWRLSQDALDRLQTEADRRSLRISQLIEDFAQQLPPPTERYSPHGNRD